MAGVSWSYEGPALAREGYCVFALNYGKFRGIVGRDKIQNDAAQLGRFVTRVLRATHRRHVALVSHSAGGTVARYYLRFLDGDDVVRELVALAPADHPTRLKHSCPLLCSQLNGQWLYRRLNDDGELRPRVDYTVIESKYDGAIVPYATAFLHGRRRHLTNVLLQRHCPRNRDTHIALLIDPLVLRWVKNALDRPGPANPRYRPACG